MNLIPTHAAVIIGTQEYDEDEVQIFSVNPDLQGKIQKAMEKATQQVESLSVEKLKEKYIIQKVKIATLKSENKDLRSALLVQQDQILALQAQILEQQLMFTNTLATLNGRCNVLERQYADARDLAYFAIAATVLSGGIGLVSSTVGWGAVAGGVISAGKSVKAMLLATQIAKVLL